MDHLPGGPLLEFEHEFRADGEAAGADAEPAPPLRLAEQIADMRRRRAATGLAPMVFGVAGYAIVRETEREAQQEIERITNVQDGSPGYENYRDWLANTQLEQQVSLQEYSVSNRGLRSGLVGTAEQVGERVAAFEKAGADLLLLQFSPQLEEMESFARHVIRRN